MSHRIVAGAVCFCLAVAATGGARSTATVQPGRQRTGNAAIAGRSFDAATNAPIRRAQIHGSSNELIVDAVSDDEGRFQLNDLPAVAGDRGEGRLLHLADRSTTPVRPTRRRSHSRGQRVRADVGLSRGGVIAGRVYDNRGEPLADSPCASIVRAWPMAIDVSKTWGPPTTPTTPAHAEYWSAVWRLLRRRKPSRGAHRFSGPDHLFTNATIRAPGARRGTADSSRAG